MAIAVLPPDVAATIAAGEVVERPASIVRELVDNALDAGARRIEIEVAAGGVELIRIADDGCGVPPAELPLAFLRHATSKLHRPEDLAAVATLGFRGEALPSIAAAADVEFASRPEGTAAGSLVRLSAGTIVRQASYTGARGTVVTVRDLFARQPARRKFLRSGAAESGQIATLVGLYAMAYPEVSFTLLTDGRRTLATTGAGERRDAVARVYGTQTASSLLELTVSATPTGAPVVGGLIAPPDLTRANRNYMSCFVNRRIVQPRRLVFPIEAAYESLMPTGRHPIVILDLRLPPEQLDVNVHPTKNEIRFVNERDVHTAVYHRIRERLEAVSPVSTAAGALFGPFRPDAGAAPVDPPRPMPLWRAIGQVEEHVRQPVPLPGPPERPLLPILRVVGQAGSLYIVAEGPDGMYLVDQHAAHERVLYERIVDEQSERRLDIQGLLSPVTVEMTAAQEAALASHADALRDLGFELEPFGDRTYLLRAVPTLLANRDPARMLGELLDDLAGDGAAERSTNRATQAAMTVACHAAVRAGKTMAMPEMRELLALLESCRLPRTCPHGRPTMIHLSTEALEREFRRR